MGETFRYITDSAMTPSSLDECQHCGRSDVPCYDYVGEIIDPQLAADSKLAIDEPEISAACAECINGGNLCKSEYELDEIAPVIDAFSRNRDESIENYHRIPQIPLMMQSADWPMCCND